jgi:hypothetical protein
MDDHYLEQMLPINFMFKGKKEKNCIAQTNSVLLPVLHKIVYFTFWEKYLLKVTFVAF